MSLELPGVKRLIPLPDDGAQMPEHTSRCMVCGQDNPEGWHLTAFRRGEEVVCQFVFDQRHEGGPGLAHGGAVAAVCDDVLGHVLTLLGSPAVTRRLEVDYLRPVLLGEPHTMVGRIESTEGRKIWLTMEALASDGQPRFTARGLFIRVGLEHFLAGLSPEERERATAKLAELRERGEDVTAW